MILFSFFWHASLAQLSLAVPTSWILWTDMDGADFFWTSGNCSTMVLPDSGIVGNEAPRPPSTGGISDLLFFPDTHEVLWLEGGHLVRSWMDKTGRTVLASLPGDANRTDLQTGNGTGPTLGVHGEDGSIAWTQRGLTAVLFFASKVTQKLWMANLSSIPPRDPSHLGPWFQVPGVIMAVSTPVVPVLLAKDGMVYWTNGNNDTGTTFRSWDVMTALTAAMGTSESMVAPGTLVASLASWGEIWVAEVTNDNRFLWIRRSEKPSGTLHLELILSLATLEEGPNANYATGNVRTLYTFLEGDLPTALAVQPKPGPGLPYYGNVTQLYQQIYWSVSGPEMQARIDHLDMATGKVSTLSYSAALERRGAAPVRPSALSVYPMPDVCVNVGCLFLTLWEECRICTEDQCDTCFMDTQDWVVKQWYASHSLFSHCIWLFPPDQAAWFVRQEVNQAKADGKLPDDFVAEELPPEGATPPQATEPTAPPTITTTTVTFTSTTSITTATQTSTTSTSMTLSSTNPCTAIEVPEGVLSEDACVNLVDAWCKVSSLDAVAPLALRRDCATYPWTFKELCDVPSQQVNQDSPTCQQPLWSYAILAAGLALILATMLPFFCCASMRRQHRHGSHRGTGHIRNFHLRDAAVAEQPNLSSTADAPQRSFCSCWSRCFRRHRGFPTVPEKSKVDEKNWKAGQEPHAVELDVDDTDEPELVSVPWSEGSPRFSGAEESVPMTSMGVQQILKGTWQPGLSTSSAAAAAGRLTNAMQKFMSPSTRQGDKWRLLHDVEDILRTLGSALPGNLRTSAWAWHARQSGRLHRSQAIFAAEEEAKAIEEDFREDLSQRLQSGVRLLEVSALAGGQTVETDTSDAPSAMVTASLQKASKLQISLDQLKSRMEELNSSDNKLITAGHLLDGYENLMRLAQDVQMAKEEGDLSGYTDQLSKEIKELKEAIESKLEESGVPSGTWLKMAEPLSPKKVGRKGTQATGFAWSKSLKEAASRAARFAQALKGSQDNKQLDDLEKKLVDELKVFEAAAKAGDDDERGAWKQLKKLWSQQRNDLEEARKKKSQGDSGGRLSSWAMQRSKLMPKRSHTQPLQSKDLSPELSASAAEVSALQENVEKFRQKLRTESLSQQDSETPSGKLLKAGREHLQQQDLEKLLQAVKAGESHLSTLDVDLVAGQNVSSQWQQLRRELEDLEAELALDPTQRPSTSGRLSLGIASRLSPKRATAHSSSKGKPTSETSEILEAARFLRSSDELARLRSQQAEDDGSNPMLTLGQSIHVQQELETIELQVAKALKAATARGDGEEWRALQELWQGLQSELREVKERAKRQEQEVRPGAHATSVGAVRSGRYPAEDENASFQAAHGTRNGGAAFDQDPHLAAFNKQGGKTRLTSGEQDDLQSFLETLQQSLEAGQKGVPAQVLKLSSICQKLGLHPTREGWLGDEELTSGARSGGNANFTILARLSSKDRMTLLSTLSDLQEHVQAGDSKAWNKLEEICRQLGLEAPTLFRHSTDLVSEDLSEALAAAQKRMARLEEQLELQRESLQRRRRKSIQAPPVLAGHSLLHQSLLDAAAKEHEKCRADCEELQALTDDGSCQQLFVQSSGLQQLLKGCEDSSLRLRQGLLEAAEGSPNATVLLSALGDDQRRSSTAYLSAALQRLARLDDQLEQQRAALGARGRRRRQRGINEETLTGFVEEKMEALALLADTLKDSLDEKLQDEVYDAWHAQLTSGLEHMVAIGITTGTDEDGSPQHSRSHRNGADPGEAMAEARHRLAELEAACEQRKAKVNEDSRHLTKPSEDMIEVAKDLRHLQEQFQRHRNSLQQWRSEIGEQELPKLATKLVMNDRSFVDLAEQHRACGSKLQRLQALDHLDGRLKSDEMMFQLAELKADYHGVGELLSACKDGANVLAREIQEAGEDPTTAALLASRHGGAGTSLEMALDHLAADLQNPQGFDSTKRDDLLAWLDAHLEGDPALEHLRALVVDGSLVDHSKRGQGSHPEAFGLEDSIDDRRAQLRRMVEHLDEKVAKQRSEIDRRRTAGDATGLDDKILASLVDERAALLEWIDEQLKHVDDPVLRQLRDLCQDNAQHLEQLVISDLEAREGNDAEKLEEAKRRLAMLEEEAANRARSKDLFDGTKKKTFDDDDLLSELEEAQRRLARFDWELEQQRAGLQRRRKKGEQAVVDPEILASLVSERTQLVDWAEDWLQKSDDPKLYDFRKECRERARQLEQLVMFDLEGASLGTEDLLVKAQERLATLDSTQSSQPPNQNDSSRLHGSDGTKKRSFEDGLLSELEEARRRLAGFDSELERQRAGLQRRLKNGEDASLDPEILASLVSERADLVEWADAWLKKSDDMALQEFRKECRDRARQLEQLVISDVSRGASDLDPSALLAEARRRLLMLEEEAKQRFQRRQVAAKVGAAAKAGASATKKTGHLDDSDWDAAEAQRRLARFDEELERQRAKLERRRKNGEEATVDEEVLASLVAERADLVELAEEWLKKSDDMALQEFRKECRDRARQLEQLVISDVSRGATDLDPSALLAEARRRLILMEEEAAKQRLKRQARGNGPTAGGRELPRRKVQDEDPQVLMAEAARRLAHLEEQLSSQREGLCRRRLQPKTEEAPEVLAAHALLHESAIQALKQERDQCRSECERLVRVAGKWSPQQRASCQQLRDKCNELEEAWNSCVETAEILKEEVAEAAPSRLTAILRQDAQDTSQALAEAMQRVAAFDHEVEQQRQLIQRRRKAGATNVGAEDAVLTALLEEKRQAIAQCEEMGESDQAWQDLQELWHGPLTSSLLNLANPSPAKSFQVEAMPEEAAKSVAEARLRLDRLDEESQRQRLGLQRRRKKTAEAGKEELEKLVESGTEFAELAQEHREGLKNQQNNITEVISSDHDAVDEIESWRQMVGLEELQAAASKMSEQLATSIEANDSEEVQADESQERTEKRKRFMVGEVTEEKNAAKQQCHEMQARLKEMRGDEEERQRLLLQRRQRRLKEPPAHAELAAQVTEENSRDLLLRAHECITEGNSSDLQALRQQLHDLREEAFTESKEEPEASRESSRAVTPEAKREPPKEELAAALAASEDRIDVVNHLGANLLSELEALFQSHETEDLEKAVLKVVERWRGQLQGPAQVSADCTAHLEQMGVACKDALRVALAEDDSRKAFMEAYRQQMSNATKATEVQAQQEEEGLRARAAARRKKEAVSPTRPSTSRRPVLTRQATVLGSVTTEVEVKDFRQTGEGFARSFLLQTEEEEEEQARRMARRLEARSQSRSRPGTAAPSPDASPVRRGLQQSFSMTTSSGWAWSPSRPVSRGSALGGGEHLWGL